MTKIHNFIKDTDFKSVGNDDSVTLILTIPPTFTIPVGGLTEFHTDITIGRRNAPMMVQMTNSRQPGFTTPTSTISIKGDNWSMPSSGNLGERWSSAYVYRLDAMTVRLQAVFGTQGEPETITVTGASQTVTAKIKTFLDPFSN